MAIASVGFLMIVLDETPPGGDMTTIEGGTYTHHPPITLRSNIEFANQAAEEGWKGNGTSSNPYLIENLLIRSDAECVDVSDITVHFVVRNCFLSSTPELSADCAAISIFNSSNARLESCIVHSNDDGMQFFFSHDCTINNCTIEALCAGVNATESHDLRFENSKICNCTYGATIIGSPGVNLSHNRVCHNEWGVLAQFSDFCILWNNTISENQEGADLQILCANWSIRNNTVLNNTGVGIRLGEQTGNISLLYNRLGWNEIDNAMDDGSDNKWDDGVDQGNYWSDYDGSGIYLVPGSAGSVDHYPLLLEESDDTTVLAAWLQSLKADKHSECVVGDSGRWTADIDLDLETVLCP
jgi:parallel beta-helix repeat protein